MNLTLAACSDSSEGRAQYAESQTSKMTSGRAPVAFVSAMADSMHSQYCSSGLVRISQIHSRMPRTRAAATALRYQNARTRATKRRQPLSDEKLAREPSVSGTTTE